MNTSKQYSVVLFVTHPNLDNDDCISGDTFETEEGARRVIADLGSHFNYAAYAGCCYVMLDGPNVNEITEIPGARRRIRIEEAIERSERAMQAGMMGGCQAYNEEMGYC